MCMQLHQLPHDPAVAALCILFGKTNNRIADILAQTRTTHPPGLPAFALLTDPPVAGFECCNTDEVFDVMPKLLAQVHQSPAFFWHQ